MQMHAQSSHCALATWTCLATFAGSALAAPAPQVPDGLDLGTCCASVAASLPDFAGFDSEDDILICFEDCDDTAVFEITSAWEAPTQVVIESNLVCSLYQTNVELRLQQGSQVTIFSGLLGMIYSRTWWESNQVGWEDEPQQVWRFLLNGDLVVSTEGGDPVEPCPVPECAASFGGKVRFTGYVDYAYDIDNQVFSHAWALNHDCDEFDHHVPAASRGGTFHPGHSYTFVSPGSTFVVAVDASEGNAPELGDVVAENLRRLDLSQAEVDGAVCLAEEPVSSTDFPDMSEYCACSSSFAGQYATNADPFSIYTPCALTAGIAAGATEYVSKGIGYWTNSSRYPGPERLRINFAEYYNADPCTPQSRSEFFHGVTTLEGWGASAITGTGQLGPLPNTFIDMSNSLSFAQNPIRNVRYWSDLVVNLNVDPNP